MEEAVEMGERGFEDGVEAVAVVVVGVVREGSSVSVSEEERSASQESATGLHLGFARGFVVVVADLVSRVRWERVLAISASEGVLRAIIAGVPIEMDSSIL